MLTDLLDNHLISLLVLVLAGLVLTRAVYYRQKSETLNKEVQELRTKVIAANSELRELRHKYTVNIEFQKDLNEAGLTTRLQQPRLAARHGSSTIEPPERYLYVRSLVDKGLDAHEIAAILSLSTVEAEQLVNLSRLVPPAEPN